jgi:hypothetical protein
MTCLRDQSGKLLCQIIEHPDRPNQSFCSTCGNRYSRFVPASTSEPTSPASPMLTEIIVGLLSLLLAAGLSSLGKSINSPPAPPSSSQPPTYTDS